ncbi:MAG: NAD(P)H-binding protein [Pseudomonadota bacterium]
MKVTLLGSSGTIGRAVLRELRLAGHTVTAPSRREIAGCDFTGQDAVISCIASRTGAPADAWNVDYETNADMLSKAQRAGVAHFVLLSAICVERPRLAFQYAKRAFEEALAASGLTYSIVRPTAFFKSLSGQIERVRAGKPFLVFGNGRLTSCKPISDRDLARFLVSCLTDSEKHNAILPIGGPGPALTPLDQAKLLGEALGMSVTTRSVPPGVLAVLAKVMGLPGKLPFVFTPRLNEKAALARIGHYYATHSMLVWTGTDYDAGLTPEYGTDTLAAHYRALARGDLIDDRGAHAVF